MTTPAAPLSGLAGRFLALHHSDRPLLQPNAHDVGTARRLESLGFDAVATTSGGFAATLGRVDGGVTRDETLAHAAQLAAAVDIPVAADTENCFADDAAGVAETVRLAADTGIAGCSVEDWSGGPSYPAGCSRPSGSPRPWRPGTAVPTSSSSPLGRRTTSTGTTTSPTRSPGSRRTRKRGPTRFRVRAWSASTTSAPRDLRRPPGERARLPRRTQRRRARRGGRRSGVDRWRGPGRSPRSAP